MTLGKPQEQALHFDAAAGDEQRVQPPRAEIAEPFHQSPKKAPSPTLKQSATWHTATNAIDGQAASCSPLTTITDDSAAPASDRHAVSSSRCP